MRRPAMQRGQARPTAGSPAPASHPVRPAGSCVHVAPQRFGEQHLGKPREDHLAAGRRAAACSTACTIDVLEPLAGAIVSDVHAHDARQSREHGANQPCLARRDSRRSSRVSSPPPPKRESLMPPREHRRQSAARVDRAAAPRPLPIACASPCGTIDDVAGGERRRLFADADVAAALRHEVKLDDVASRSAR